MKDILSEEFWFNHLTSFFALKPFSIVESLKIPQNIYHKVLTCYAPFDRSEFEKIDEMSKNELLWKLACESRIQACYEQKLGELYYALEYAYPEGVKCSYKLL